MFCSLQTGSDNPKKDFKTTRSQEDVCKCLSSFVGDNTVIKVRMVYNMLCAVCTCEDIAQEWP